jgi:AhpD family alkylhydroperoxidase
MKNLESLSPEQAPEISKQIFQGLKQKIGMVPNIYATIGNSGPALKATLSIGESLAGGEYSPKETEVIALAIAQANACNYCLAAHTAVGKGVGLSSDEALAVRAGESTDEKLNSLTILAKSITETRGYPEQSQIDAFFQAGYSRAALAELIVLVGLNTITNYTNHIAGTEIDFPAAPELATA